MKHEQLVLKENVMSLTLKTDKYHNEMGALHSLFVGLTHLNNKMLHLQELAKKSRNGNVLVGFFSNLEQNFDLPIGSNALIPCFYHWFGVSAVNFVRLVGLLKGVELGDLPSLIPQNQNEKNAVKSYCNEYLSSVEEIQDLRIWRNKVFAHFSNTDSYGSDNEALLHQVSFYPISYRQGLLEVGGFQLTIGGPGPLSGEPLDPAFSSNLPSWAMTEVFESLWARYSFSLEAA